MSKYSRQNKRDDRNHRDEDDERPFKKVLIEGLVVMKIIKHIQEEGAASDGNGTLLGLVKDHCLEITNCFPHPRGEDNDEADDIEPYLNVMIRHLRNVNVDHMPVGWYLSSPYGSGPARYDNLQSHLSVQQQYEESVLLSYDPIRTQRGFLSIKAYRMSNLAMKLCKDNDFTPEILRKNGMSFTKIYEEIPVQIHNSPLMTAMMVSLDSEIAVEDGKSLLDMGSIGTMEKAIQGQMKCVEEITKFANYQRVMVQKQQQIAKENVHRGSKGEPPMTDEEIGRIIKPLSAAQRLDFLLSANQTLNYCGQSSSLAAQKMSKLYISKALTTNPTVGATVKDSK